MKIYWSVEMIVVFVLYGCQEKLKVFLRDTIKYLKFFLSID